jgi:hypothetical protein
MSLIELRPFEQPHYVHYKYMMFMMPILLDARVIVETGFQDGASTKIFLKSLEQLLSNEHFIQRRLYTVELTQPGDSEETIHVRNNAIIELQSKYSNFSTNGVNWYYAPYDSISAAKNWNTGLTSKIDFLYLDSDHKVEHVYNELLEWSKHLSDKAIIMVDDAYDYQKNVPTGPMIAAEIWMKEVNDAASKHNKTNLLNRPLGDLNSHSLWKELVFPEMHGPMVLYR